MGNLMVVLIALGLAVFAFLASSAGMKTFAKVLGVASFLAFVGWLASGPGWAVLDWIENPKPPAVNVPDVRID